MKTFMLSALMILAFAATNYGKPITDIYSIKDPGISEESYVDDIPFNTQKIASNTLINKIKSQPEEANVDDIPFSTEKIMLECLLSRMVKVYRLEENIRDIPFLIEYCNKKPSFSF